MKHTADSQVPFQAERDEFQEVLEMIRDMMGDFYQSARISAELHEMNISDDWSEGVKEILQSPLKSSFDALQSIELSIISMIQSQFRDFLRTNSHLFDSVYLLKENSLHYAIVLKNDTIESEAELLEFKMDYDSTPISKKFPLIISFPEADHLQNSKVAREIEVG